MVRDLEGSVLALTISRILAVVLARALTNALAVIFAWIGEDSTMAWPGTESGRHLRQGIDQGLGQGLHIGLGTDLCQRLVEP